jgi:hypothetical protein
MSDPAAVRIRKTVAGVPALSARSQGWLRYIFRKATTADNWGRDGAPHPHWDNKSEAPMLSWHRFDLIDSCYAVALMADHTPAWREVYGRILGELVTRHTGWWSASDWLTQFGHDPDRANYPDEYRLLIPPNLWGDYDSPGWTANGVAPWGLQMDPIGADGNLFYKGWFLVMLGLFQRTTGDTRWEYPFEMIRDGDHTFTWTHHGIADHLAAQWAGRPDGCHCENTKIWPLCLTAAGMGLRLADLVHGTNHHDVFRRWWIDKARPDYMNFADDTAGDAVTFYYDPLVEQHHVLPAFAASTIVAHYLAAQLPDDAKALWRSGRAQLGLGAPPYNAPTLGPRFTAIHQFLAVEWNDAELALALRDAANAQLEPTWDLERGEFTWGFGLGEEYPRGQWNAAMAAAEANTEGGWWRLANTWDTQRFAEPTLVDVDFPAVTPTQAWWDRERGELTVALAPLGVSERGARTRFRVTNLDPSVTWTASAPDVHIRFVDRDLEVRAPLDHISFVVSAAR